MYGSILQNPDISGSFCKLKQALSAQQRGRELSTRTLVPPEYSMVPAEAGWGAKTSQ